MHSATPTGECRSWNAHASLLCTLFLAGMLLGGCGSEALYLTRGTESATAAGSEGSDGTISATTAGSEDSGGTNAADSSGIVDVEDAGDGFEAAASGSSDAEAFADADDGDAGDESGLDASSDSAENSGSVYVYVCGAVESPGVYQLDEGSRVYDAITAAGGLRKDASEDYWNQAALVSDGQMIDVPTVAEVEAGLVDTVGTSSGSGADATSGSTSSGSNLDTTSGSTSSGSGTDETSGSVSSGSGTDAASDADSASSSDRININTATAAELMEIPGIGEARAEAIISYREESGGFSSIEDIKNVSGIGDALFEKMKDYIEV